jgi:hypothetical protein
LNEVIKREVLEGDKAKDATKKITKASGKKLKTTSVEQVNVVALKTE